MKKNSPCLLWISQVAAFIFFAAAVSVFASNSLLDKGAGLLKTIKGSDTATALTTDEIAKGLKEALRVGSETVVKQLGAKDGFNTDSAIHIPLPQSLASTKKYLGKVGMSGLLDDLELKLNRAAEAATPKARQLFLDAISGMTLDDVKKIYEGPDDAATQYFKQKMSPQLAEEMTPVIDDTLSQVGAVNAYDNTIKEYKKIPFVPDVKADLTKHVVDKGMDGIFYYLAKEEAAIRQNPVKRTTELLQKVFGR
jgi:hypothetical protein